MSMRWDMPEVPEAAKPEPPPLWLFAVLYVVVELAAIGFAVFNWPPGKPVVSGTFVLAVLVLPFLVWLALSAALWHRYEEDHNDYSWHNLLRQHRTSYWREWTQAHMVLIGSVVLTPEDELAERMLGLEGSVPMNPDKVMPLPVANHIASTQSRVEQVLERLLTPLSASVSRLAGTHTFEVVLQSGKKEHVIELQQVWRKLGLSDLVRMAWLPLDAEPPMVEQWFGSKRMPDFRLVLALQLHDGEEEPAWSEVAVALLMTSPTTFAAFKGKLKHQACLFRPIVEESDTVDIAISTLLRAEQAPRKKLRHFWFSHLEKQLRHATTTAVKEAGLNLAAHDVDRAIGKPGPLNGWLVQATAAQMVQHGQGAQLIAAPFRKGVALNIVGSHPAPVAFAPDWAPLLSASSFLALCAMFGFCATLPHVAEPDGDHGGFMIAVAAICVVVGLIHIGMAIWTRRSTTRKFWQTYS